MNILAIPVQSISDLITNSSSEVFILDTGKTCEEVNDILKGFTSGFAYPEVFSLKDYREWRKKLRSGEIEEGWSYPGTIFEIAIGSTGEPTMHPDFCEFLETVYNTGVVPNYTTNGLIIARDNVGYCIEIDGKVFAFLTDLGEITPTAAEYIRKANYLILEANYDEEMLRMGTYPQYLKERITSRTGHMSNIATAEFLSENMTEHLQYIWLCHLSKDNNHPELAYKTVEWKLREKGIIVGKDVQLCALKRTTPSDLYEFE